MSETKKITEDQLEKIVSQQKDLNMLLGNIGVLETQKHSLLHQVAELNKNIEDFKAELEAEYGAININLEDGSYTAITEENNG
jgi:predicted  nucleic acid-binding Zn-ribbon protein